MAQSPRPESDGTHLALVDLEQLDLEALAGLAHRVTLRLGEDGEVPALELRRMGWDLLDLVRRPSVLVRIASTNTVPEWTERILSLVERSHFTVGPLFRRRVDAYGSKVLFEIPSSAGGRTMTWRQAGARVDALARGFLALDRDASVAPLAILSENCIEAALVDLACLTTGIVNVLLPATSTEADVSYMLAHAGVRTVVVSDREQLRRVMRTRESLPLLRRIVILEPRAASGRDTIALDDVTARAGQVSPVEIERRSEAVKIDELATIMYTSGTTGTPKGIQFSHRNIVFKRFARALSLPEIGEDDVFLCYLPLYHTFGRFFELMGCVFWGATYCFLDNPSVGALVQGMRRNRPTVFISVPKKWIQLHEAIREQVPSDRDSDEEHLAATRLLTGGRLRWGLSAAGQLDTEVFTYFHRQDIELLSGFGMTEATGGITMTPPSRYKEESLGIPLPGIETKLAEGGELLIRGPYVMLGYLDAPAGESSFDDDGWFHTGDLMEIDANGYYRLVDRKKEIYKNIKGETIAPQRIENLFRDFESIGRVFLVGDHREYNSALIYPSPKHSHLALAALSPEEVKAHFRSIVASVNAFLAPFERIVDFAVIPRDLDPERGELTAKGTPRRKIVEQNFADVIRLLYRRAHMSVGGVDVIFPNWLFQALGLTAQDLLIVGDRIALPSGGTTLLLHRVHDGMAKIGSCFYAHRPGPINLGVLLTTPRLWLGNEELVNFVPLEMRLRERPGRASEGVEWSARSVPFQAERSYLEDLKAALRKPDLDLMDLNLAAGVLGSTSEEGGLAAVHLLRRVLGEEEGSVAEPARLLLSRAASSSSLAVRRRAFQTLVPVERESRFATTLKHFFQAPGVLLDGETRAVLCEQNLSDAKLDAFAQETIEVCRGTTAGRGKERRASALLRFLADYGSVHPTRYRKLRAFLVRTMLFAERESVRQEAARAVDALQDGFRSWLGPTIRLAVDPETGREYRWESVVAFEDSIDAQDRQRLLSAIQNTPFLREAVFLFSEGATIRLSDIPPGGVSIRLLDSRHGKSVYRITVQTRFQGSYDIAANVNQSLDPWRMREEIHWLILCGEPGHRDPLVEGFGGTWKEQDLWSEEFIAGETLDRVLRRLSKQPDADERLAHMWPFFAWSALASYVDFWNRTGRTWQISDPTMANVIVPTHDYQTATRLVSVSSRSAYSGLVPMFRTFREEFVVPAERQYPILEGIAGWDVIFSSVLEIVGEEDGLRMLREALHRDGEGLPEDLRGALGSYISSVEVRGFLPMRLFFAGERYRRWARLSGEATQEARARTLQEFYDTYGLQGLTPGHAEARVRFFRETVFRDAPEALASGLEKIIARLRRGELVGDTLIDAIADLRAELSLGPDEDYFLTRLSFPYLRPEDAAGFVHADLGGKHLSEIVVTLEDHDGNRFHVRHALNPKEVGRLHRLFLAAKLDVRFRPEHQVLVALSERGQIIGGIYYEVEEEGRSAHLEKIVVDERFRKKGVADGLMKEFFNRLRSIGVKTVTTGFFRPEYFYGYGFMIEKRYAGLVKSLEG